MRIVRALRADPGSPDRALCPSEGQWWRAYEYMQAFPGTSYDTYLDTPIEAVDWLTRIHAVVEKHRAEQQQQADRRG